MKETTAVDSAQQTLLSIRVPQLGPSVLSPKQSCFDLFISIFLFHCELGSNAYPAKTYKEFSFIYFIMHILI